MPLAAEQSPFTGDMCPGLGHAWKPGASSSWTSRVPTHRCTRLWLAGWRAGSVPYPYVKRVYRLSDEFLTQPPTNPLRIPPCYWLRMHLGT